MSVARVLIIAGSDSGGGAGIQADIKTVTMLGGHAMTAVTAITAQNSVKVEAVMPVPAEMVVRQIDAVVRDIGVDAVKIGMIGSAETAGAVAQALDALQGVPIVLDPVMVATTGASLADAATVSAFRQLMAKAKLVTPNAPELEVLAGQVVETAEDLEAAARRLAEDSGAAVLAKGGHLAGNDILDLLVTPGGTVERWNSQRIETRHTHGTGCTLASAIATRLGQGEQLVAAIAAARQFVREALRAAPGFGAGHGPMGHAAAGPGPMNLNQVTLPAHDYDQSVRFYRDLGLTQIVDAPPRYARFECPGGATLSIHCADDQPAAVVYLESTALDRWVETLHAQGVTIESGPEDKPWLWREVRLRDPAGNRICLYSAGTARRFPPWRIG